MLPILNIAGYKFIALHELTQLRLQLLNITESLQIKGTILLSNEGINISLAGKIDHVIDCKQAIKSINGFEDLSFHETYSEEIPFQRLKIKLKKEIITFKQQAIDNTKQRAKAISPEMLKQWLDDNHDFTLLDTRNEYEIDFGTFKTATNLHLKDFTDLPEAVDALPREKTVVMFCTGGIRCEKAALYMQQQGFTDVHQLDGGILGYFANVGGKHYDGDCFVFDERVAIDPSLQVSNKIQKID